MPKTRKPKVTLRPVANQYSADGEHIIEYSAADGSAGGLISFRTGPDGKLHVELYRHDKDVVITVGKPTE